MTDSEARRELGGSAPELGLWSVLYGVLGAPIAWTLHLFVSYLLVTIGCNVVWGGTVPAILIATALFAAAAFGSGVVAYRRWRVASGTLSDWREAMREPRGQGSMLWMIGILLAGLFGFVILLAGIAPLFVPLCGSFLTR